jgi:hypothetical protein
MATSSTVNKALPANTVNAAVTTSQIFPQLNNALVPAYLAVPGSGRFEQQKFWVRAQGFATSAGNFTVVITLFGFAVLSNNKANPLPANPFTPGSWTVIGASTARAVNTVSRPWTYEAELQFDSTSGVMHGIFEDFINNLYDARAAVTNTLAGVNGTFEPCIVLAVGITFSSGNVGNIGTLYEFVLDK